MDEYIEREALINHVEDLPTWGADGSLLDREDVIGSIENRLAADVAPVRHGRWTTTSGEVFPGSSQFLCYSHKHDECGFQYVDMDENEYDYCPNCGCRMDLEG